MVSFAFLLDPYLTCKKAVEEDPDFTMGNVFLAGDSPFNVLCPCGETDKACPAFPVLVNYFCFVIGCVCATGLELLGTGGRPESSKTLSAALDAMNSSVSKRSLYSW